MGRKRQYLVVAVLIFGLLGARTGFAAGNDSVEEKIADLQQQIDILKRQLEVDKEVSVQKAKEAPVVTASAKDGFSIKSPDDTYKLKVSGYVQADARIFPDNRKDTGTTDTFTDRTVRLAISGTVAKDFEYFISPEFAGTSVTLPDAYLDWKLNTAIKLRGGKFKAPFAYERLQSTPASTFAEPSLAENLAPNRDSGVQVYGDLLGESVNYAVALTNGVVDAGGSTSAADTNNDKELGARVFAQPFKKADSLALRGVGLGGAVSYGHREDTVLPSYKTAGQTTFYTLAGTTLDGPQVRYAPQAAYYYHGLGVYGEYIVSDAKLTKTTRRQDIRNKGWLAAGSYVLTGEDASYKGVVPLHPFDYKKGDWGAFEVAGRYSVLDISDKVFDGTLTTNSINSTPTLARAWTAGLNWYLNRNAKFVLNWEQTNFKGGAGGGTNRPTENLILSRLQLSF